MKEKGMDELFSAAEKLHDDGYKFVLDLVGFFLKMNTRKELSYLKVRAL